jgi:hypothetical protein
VAGRCPHPAAGLLLGVLLVASLSACDDEGPRPEAVGTVVAGAGATVEGDSGFVFVPAGRIDVTVGAPLTRPLSGDEAADGAIHAPPVGGAFVPVAWTHDPAALPAPLEVAGPHPELTAMALVADGTSYPLGSPYDVAAVGGTTDALVRVLYVAVPTLPTRLLISADYDGATQTLDPASGQIGPGKAGALYHPVPRLTASSCRPGAQPGPAPRLACSVRDVAVVPYVPGAGWADPPEGWLVVHYRVDAGAADLRGVSLRLAGRAPVAVLDARRAAHRARGSVAFAGATRGGELRLTAVLAPTGARRTTTVVRTVTITR